MMARRYINFALAFTIATFVSDQYDARIPAQNPELYIVLAGISEAMIARLISQTWSPLFNACAKEVHNSQLLSASDTRDCSRFIAEVRENAGEWPWDWTSGICSILRYSKNPDITDTFKQKGCNF